MGNREDAADVNYTGLGVVALLGVVSLACLCPVTCSRTVVVRPEVDYRVVEAESGEPVEGAEIELCRVRVGPPPSEQLNSWTTETDGEGRASFSYIEESEDYAPLMMHGKSQRRWHHCVHADGYTDVEASPDSGGENARHLLSEPMNYDKVDDFGKGLETVEFRLRSEDGEEAGPLPCRCEGGEESADDGSHASGRPKSDGEDTAAAGGEQLDGSADR